MSSRFPQPSGSPDLSGSMSGRPAIPSGVRDQLENTFNRSGSTAQQTPRLSNYPLPGGVDAANAASPSEVAAAQRLYDRSNPARWNGGTPPSGRQIEFTVPPGGGAQVPRGGGGGFTPSPRGGGGGGRSGGGTVIPQGALGGSTSAAPGSRAVPRTGMPSNGIGGAGAAGGIVGQIAGQFTGQAAQAIAPALGDIVGPLLNPIAGPAFGERYVPFDQRTPAAPSAWEPTGIPGFFPRGSRPSTVPPGAPRNATAPPPGSPSLTTPTNYPSVPPGVNPSYGGQGQQIEFRTSYDGQSLGVFTAPATAEIQTRTNSSGDLEAQTVIYGADRTQAYGWANVRVDFGGMVPARPNAFFPNTDTPVPANYTPPVNSPSQSPSNGPSPNIAPTTSPTGTPTTSPTGTPTTSPTGTPTRSPQSPLGPQQTPTGPPNPFLPLAPFLPLLPLLTPAAYPGRSPGSTPARGNPLPVNIYAPGTGATGSVNQTTPAPRGQTRFSGNLGGGVGGAPPGFCIYNPALDQQIAATTRNNELLTQFITNTQLVNMDNKLGPQLANGGVSGFLQRFAKSSLVNSTMNAITMFTTIHNAFMLSNNIRQTLFSAFDTIYELPFMTQFAPRSPETGEVIPYGEFASNTAETFFRQAFGDQTVDTVAKTWKKANRIYQATANILFSIQSITYSLIEGMETVGNYTALIGNAARKFGVVAEKAYGWMNPNLNFQQSRFFNALNNTQEAVEAIDEVAGETLNIVQTTTELGKQKTELENAVKGVNAQGQPVPLPPNSPTHTTTPQTVPVANAEQAAATASKGPAIPPEATNVTT